MCKQSHWFDLICWIASIVSIIPESRIIVCNQIQSQQIASSDSGPWRLHVVYQAQTTPDCAIKGVSYTDPNIQTLNGGQPLDAQKQTEVLNQAVVMIIVLSSLEFSL